MRHHLFWIGSAFLTIICGGVTAANAAQLPNLLAISPNLLEFSPVGVGSTSTNYYSVFISNPGSQPVTITGFSVKGPAASDFSATNYCPISPNTLAPGSFCNVSFSFSPTAVGTRAANFTFTVARGAAQSILLIGEGLAATKAVTFSSVVLAFPSVPLGLPAQDAPTAFVYVQSTGSVAVNLQSVLIVGPNASDFSIAGNGCYPGPLQPGVSCYLSVTFLPTATGTRKATLEVIDDAPGSAQFLPITGVGSPPLTALTFFPTAVAFAPIGTTNNESAQINIQNTGSEPVTINGLLVTGPNASDFPLVQNYCQPIPYTLLAQNQCTLEILFTPGATGTRLANLEIVDSVPGSPQSIPLEGSGQALSVSLSFSPGILDFGAITQGSPSYLYVYLQNSGTEAAQVSLGIQGIDASDFSQSAYCQVIGANSSCFVPITFTPSAVGIRTAMLVATDSVTGQSQSLVLVGGGIAPGAVLTATPPEFAPTVVGATSSGGFNFYNNGPSPVTITQFQLSGPAKSDYAIVQNSCPPGYVLGGYGYCSGQMSFSPSAQGARVAEISVAYSGGSGPVILPIAGLATAPSRSIGFGGSSLDFGPQSIGVPVTNTISISNTGTESVSISGISLAGPNARDFAITENQCPVSPATLGPGSNCQVNVQFTASVVGTRLGRLQATDNASGSPQSLSLVGFGSDSAGSLSIYPNPLTFPALPLGSSVQESVYLNSIQGAPVSLTGIQVVGPNANDFVLSSNCSTPVTYCDAYITFTPSVTGLRLASLQITDNATGSPQIIPLSGMGVKSTPPTTSITLAPVPLVFPQSVGLGYTEQAYLTLSNVGTTDVLLTAFHTGGRNAGDFGIQSNNCPLNPAPLPAGQSCQITIVFGPSATGIRLANFSVTDNASGSPQSIAMIGEGVAPTRNLRLSATSIIFTPTPVGSTDYYGGSMNVTNTGSLPVTIQSIGISGADASDFSLFNSCGPSLNPGSSCPISLNFTPSATGTRTAQLIISSDAKGSPQKVSLSGVGE